MNIIPNCLRCQSTMELGYSIDRSYLSFYRSNWFPGVATQDSFFGIEMSALKLDLNKKARPITTYRCPKCGYLESYAD